MLLRLRYVPLFTTRNRWHRILQTTYIAGFVRIYISSNFFKSIHDEYQADQSSKALFRECSYNSHVLAQPENHYQQTKYTRPKSNKRSENQKVCSLRFQNIEKNLIKHEHWTGLRDDYQRLTGRKVPNYSTHSGSNNRFNYTYRSFCVNLSKEYFSNVNVKQLTFGLKSVTNSLINS